MDLIVDGDSWVFGSEICDPEFLKSVQQPGVHIGNYDHKEENDNYRIPRTFATLLANKLNANCYNLAWPADDNTTICNRTIDFVTKNYIDKNVDMDDVFVIVGWSSPERNSFWFKDDITGESRPHQIWPSLRVFDNKKQEKFWELYVAYYWNREEYLPRFVDTVSRFENFCKVHGIKYLMFNAFYQNGGSGCDRRDGIDVNIAHELEELKFYGGYQYSYNGKRVSGLGTNTKNYIPLWDLVDPIRYYNKDKVRNSFKSFVLDNVDIPFNGDHPSEQGHNAWADELHSYITTHKLL